MRKIVLAFLFVLCVSSSSFAACYLVVTENHSLPQSRAEDIARLELSRYVEALSADPPVGLSERDCVYRLDLTDLKPGVLITIKGRRLSSYAKSHLEGIQGLQQALFRSILKKDPSAQNDICQRHGNLMSDECSPLASPTRPVVTELTVYDPVTSLTWQKTEGGKLNWKAARAYCKNLVLADLDNWRLPNRQEIQSSRSLQTFFPERQDYYWSSTPYLGDKYNAWGYTVTNGELFSDWIENLYHVRCVVGDELKRFVPTRTVQNAVDPEDTAVAPAATDEKTGLSWIVRATYISGIDQVSDVYVHNIKEQGHSIDDETVVPLGASFEVAYQRDSGLRFSAGIGPFMYLVALADDEEYRFTALPLEAHLGYTLPIGAEESSAFFLAAGISRLNAGGKFVESETMGATAMAGMEILRNKRVSFGFEAGLNTASVKLEKFDCSASATPADLSTCSSKFEKIKPMELTASFLVIF